MLRKLDIHVKKNKNISLHPTQHSKWIKYFSVRPEIANLLELKIEEKFHDIGLDSDFFLDITPEANLKK